MQGLLKSRKFRLAVYGLIQTVVLYYFNIPSDIIVAADALIISLIGGIALEDAGRNAASTNH